MLRDLIDCDEFTLQVDFAHPQPLVHFQVHADKYTPSLHKYVRDVLLEDLLITLGSLGYNRVFAIIPASDKKLIKFCESMRFQQGFLNGEELVMVQDIL